MSVRYIYNTKKTAFLSVLNIAVNNMSCNSSSHTHVITLKIRGEEMRDIRNKCSVGSSTNCEISINIIKSNWYNLFLLGGRGMGFSYFLSFTCRTDFRKRPLLPSSMKEGTFSDGSIRQTYSLSLATIKQ